jgi:hypothetical protein
MENEFDDLTAFQISPEDLEKIAAIQRAELTKPPRKRREPFALITHTDAVAGFKALRNLGALVWYALCYRAWAEKSRTVRLPTKLLQSWGVHQKPRSRAIARLERAGLIRVERAPGRAARVTLL